MPAFLTKLFYFLTIGFAQNSRHQQIEDAFTH